MNNYMTVGRPAMGENEAKCVEIDTVFSVEERRDAAVSVELGFYGITITYSLLDINGCAITSSMKECPENPENEAFNAAVDGLESLILGHFAAGLDVRSDAYLEGIDTAYTALGEQFS